MTQLAEYLQFGFVQRALAAGVFIALACGALGVFLLLRRMAMIGDGLAHFAFGAVGLALLLGAAPLGLALPLTVAAACLILHLPEKSAFYGDAAIGMVSAVGLALGVLLASLGGGFNVDLFSFLFGDVLAVSRAEVGLAIGLSLTVLGLLLVGRHELFAITFDDAHARTMGLRTGRWNRLLAALAALTVVLGIRVVGTLLVSSLIVFPAATALHLGRGFRATLALAAGLAALSVIAGLVLSLCFNAPAGACITLVNAFFFGITRQVRRR